jgi:ATP-dependent DNA helicase RecG
MWKWHIFKVGGMQMNRERLKKLLSQPESLNREFKEARTAIPKSLFETICAFLNRDGGDIFLGVNDAETITGIDPDACDKIVQEIITISNNPNFLDPPFILFPQKYEIDGRIVLHLAIPESSRVHRLKGIVFDRSRDGDFQVKSPEQIAILSNRKNSYYSDSKIYPFLTLNDFEKTTIQKARNIIFSRRPTHPWLELSDEQMFHKAGLFQRDYTTGKGGYTLAAALLFGKEEVIQGILPHYKTDALLRRENKERYDDRMDVRVNLIESFFLLMGFIEKYLPDPFYLEREQRISLRDIIFRDLVHRNFIGHAPTRIIIYQDRIEMGNSSVPFKKGTLDINNFIPHQKNPLLSKFFLQLGWVEEIGSGLININKYYPLYAPKGSFQFVEAEYFQIIFELGPVKGPVKITPMQIAMLQECGHESRSRDEILSRLNLESSGNVKRALKQLIQKEYLEYTIPEKPTSRLQKYRITAKGLEVIHGA